MEWIKVEDQLPEENETVLCGKIGDFFTDMYTFRDGKFWPWNYRKYEPSITHWMRIEPPKQ